MASQLQIDANRRNSQKSTGPRSPEGKAVSRFNALKSGIDAKAQVIPGEDASTLEALATGYHAQFQPANPLECFLVDALVHADWQLRRLRRVEAQLWADEIADAARSFRGLNEEAPLGQVFGRSRDAFTRLQRRIDSAERSYYRALTQLQRLQPPARPEEPLAPSPRPLAPDPCTEAPDPCTQAPDHAPDLASFLTGAVPHVPLPRAPAAPEEKPHGSC